MARRVALWGLALVLAACTSQPAPSTPPSPDQPAPERPAAEEPTPDEPAEQNEREEGSEQSPTSLEVPPLHPRIDGFDESVVTIETGAGAERVAVKVAATAQERRRGLMGVTELPDGVGMLFLFDEQRTGGFWMRDTLVPLDIAFIRGDGSIGTIRSMEPCTTEDPSACPVTTPPHAYRTALEVPAGWFEAHDVAEGDHVRWREPRPELT